MFDVSCVVSGADPPDARGAAGGGRGAGRPVRRAHGHRAHRAARRALLPAGAADARQPRPRRSAPRLARPQSLHRRLLRQQEPAQGNSLILQHTVVEPAQGNSLILQHTVVEPAQGNSLILQLYF